jgi:hypothetical protein
MSASRHKFPFSQRTQRAQKKPDEGVLVFVIAPLRLLRSLRTKKIFNASVHGASI